MNKRTRKLIRHLRQQGVEVQRGASHYKVKDSSGRLVAVLGSESDHRTWKNMRSNLRKAGIEVPDSII